MNNNSVIPQNFWIILCTCPNKEAAEKVAYILLEQRLAACVNIIPAISSIYRWHNTIEKTEESLLLIKSDARCYTKLEAEIRKVHPYETPEIVALAMEQALPEYLQWLQASLITEVK